MTNRSAFWLGGILILIGLVYLAGALFHIDAGSLLWPLILVALGAWLLLRTRQIGPGTYADFRFIGDIKRSGAFVLAPEDTVFFIGDVDYDLTLAQIPSGETRLRMNGFIGDVDIFVPSGVGFRVICVGLVSDVHFLGQRRSSFLSPVDFTSPDYASADRKVFLEMGWFIGDINIKGG